MKRRLACVDVPHVALQLYLRNKPEWKNEPVVILDRDEPTGKIVDLSDAAASLGLGCGLPYGPCLGIHRNLKGGVVPEEAVREWQKTVLESLLRFSPHVELSWFQNGTFWLDARGLSALFPSVKAWLEDIREAIQKLGFRCGLAAGSRRFATYAAARLQPMGPVNIFSDEDAEEIWMHRVPIHVIPMSDEAMTLFKRLRLLKVKDVMDLPERDIAHRLSREAARMAVFIREDMVLPLQYLEAPEPAEWSIELDEPVEQICDLLDMGKRLIDRSLLLARKKGHQIQNLEFHFRGSSFDHVASIRPAHPTRNGARLVRLLESRIEYLEFHNPVHAITCRCLYTQTRVIQKEMFGQDHRRHHHEAMLVLGSLQAERGPKSVQTARIVEDPLPMRQFRLQSWGGDWNHGAKESLPITPSTNSISVRRIALIPQPFQENGDIRNRVVYSGGWWAHPYHYQMAYAFSSGRWHWIQSEQEGSWNRIGWVD